LPIQTHSFTFRTPGRAKELITDIGISSGYDPQTSHLPHPEIKSFKAVWDTGATNSVIAAKVVAGCGLQPISKALVNTANGVTRADVYMVNIRLPNSVAFPNVRVTEGDLGGYEVLIGMDIIAQGDFAITNKEGKTVFSFRFPSLAVIDFSAGTQVVKIGRNEPCPCGSGEKYKKCCGQ
jgi:hypothetical protein